LKSVKEIHTMNERRFQTKWKNEVGFRGLCFMVKFLNSVSLNNKSNSFPH
jgi:hypothetical protein